jgi:hypothetical protein
MSSDKGKWKNLDLDGLERVLTDICPGTIDVDEHGRVVFYTDLVRNEDDTLEYDDPDAF